MIVDQAPENNQKPAEAEIISDVNSETRPQETEQQDQKAIPFWRVMLSVIQASIGVQNAKNKERDFSQGKLLPFIIAALLFTGFFVMAVMLAVNLALAA
jgi:hypothetical protein